MCTPSHEYDTRSSTLHGLDVYKGPTNYPNLSSLFLLSPLLDCNVQAVRVESRAQEHRAVGILELRARAAVIIISLSVGGWCYGYFIIL